MQLQKVLPLNGFYGDKEPANNPFFKEAYEPDKPWGSRCSVFSVQRPSTGRAGR